MNTAPVPAPVHYHVWFNLRSDIEPAVGLATVRSFLGQLCADREARAFTLFRNRAQPPQTRLAAYHAVLEFADASQLEQAIARQARRGLHAGGHGAVINAVSDFQIEVFEAVEAS